MYCHGKCSVYEIGLTGTKSLRYGVYKKKIVLRHTVIVSMANSNNFYKGTTGKEVYSKFLKVFSSNLDIVCHSLAYRIYLVQFLI